MKKKFSQNITEFNERLHCIFTSKLDAHDISLCISALMNEYGIKYRRPDQLDGEKEYVCAFHHNDDVQAYFLDEINNNAHDRFEVFNESCMQFLDYSGALFAPKRPAVSKTVVVSPEPATKGYVGFTAALYSKLEETFFIDTNNT